MVALVAPLVGRFLAQPLDGTAPDENLCRVAWQKFCNRSPLDFRKLLDDLQHLAENLQAYIAGFSMAARETFEHFNFGDHIEGLTVRDETARIDALVAARQQVARLVEHRFAAMIAELLPSSRHSLERSNGEGAQTLRLRNCLLSLDQGWSPVCGNLPAEAGEWGVLKVGCVNAARPSSPPPSPARLMLASRCAAARSSPRRAYNCARNRYHA
ncbi:MAG: hypothetical protein M3Z66_20205, partial [Chloroflexota bacterium]|nr:hypothetical protein [Chloroflexota bacterium]